jgi:hypothetical protein
MMLALFALAPAGSAPSAAAPLQTATPAVPAFGPHVVYGIVRTIAPSSITIVRHNGSTMLVDIHYAVAVGRTGPLYAGRPVAIYGTYDRLQHFHANAVTSANGLRNGSWPADS